MCWRMNLDTLIERLQIIKENQGGDKEVFVTEHAFTQGAVECYVRKVIDIDIQYESNIDNRPVFLENDEIKSGVVIGFMPKYEEKKEDTQPTN